MDTGQAAAFFLFALVAAATPGPSNVLLAATGARAGVLRGLPALAGVVLGMGLMMALVGFGLGSLVLGHPLALQAIRWAGAAFLLWLAWKVATAHPGAEATAAGYVGVWQAAAFQWVNPKAWLVCASAVAAYLRGGPGEALGQSLLLGGLFAAAALPGCLAWLAAGAALQRLLRGPRAARAFGVAMGLLLAGSVALLLW